MFSKTHPNLPDVQDIDRVVPSAWEAIIGSIPQMDWEIIIQFMKDPDLSDLLLRVFHGDLWHNNATLEEQDVIHDIIAGIIDGDGCISGSTETTTCGGGNMKVKFLLSIDQHIKDLQVVYLPLFWFRVGNVHEYRKSEEDEDVHMMRSWKVESSKAVWVCQVLEPKLLLKKRQAKLVADKPYVMFKETQTYEALASNVTTYKTVQGAFEALGAPLELKDQVPNMFELLGEVYYFVPEGDDGTVVRMIRLAESKAGLKPKYQVLIAPVSDIRAFPSRTEAGVAYSISQNNVTQVSNGVRHVYGGHIFWSHTRWVGTAFNARSKQDREERLQVLRQVKEETKKGRDIDMTIIPSHAYFAGFFAAEGSLFPANMTGATMSVGQAYRGICDIYKNVYGGEVSMSKCPENKAYYNWYSHNIGQITEIYETWKPFLVAKMRDYRVMVETLGLKLPQRRLRTHDARECNLPDAIKTERRDKRRRTSTDVNEPVAECEDETTTNCEDAVQQTNEEDEIITHLDSVLDG